MVEATKPKSTTFVRVCLDYFGTDRKVEGTEFVALTQQDRVDLHAGFIAAGITCDAPGAGAK